MSVKRKVRRASTRPSSSFGARLVELRAEPLERRERGLRARPSRRARRPGCRKAMPSSSPRLRDLVRRADLLPLVAGASQSQRAAVVPVLLGERDLPEGEVDGRVERRRPPVADLVRVDDLLELRPRPRGPSSRSPAAIAISTWAGSARTRAEAARWISASARVIPGTRALDLALGEPEQRETRLRRAAELVRACGTPRRRPRSRPGGGGSRRSRSTRPP